MSQKGFILIPVLAFIFVIVTAGGAGFVKLRTIENKIRTTNAQVEAEFSQLHKINQQDRAVKEKVEKYEELGVDVPQVATEMANLRELILVKNFNQALDNLSQIDNKLEEALSAKREAERKVAAEARDSLETKLVDFKKKGVNVTEVDQKMPEIRGLVDSGEYVKARNQIATLSAKLDKFLAAKIEEERKAEEKRLAAAAARAAANITQSSGGVTYSRKSVSTSRGNFIADVLTINLGAVRVITDTANSDDCDNNCPTKPLSSYVSENGGIAGINGTYFCPPDYAQCAQKLSSFDFSVYNTKLGKFINAATLFWGGRAMVAFDTAGKAHFFREANQFGGVNLAAAIVNYPALVARGQIVVDEGSLPSNLGQVKGNRGALGFSGSTLFAVVGRGATVGDMAHVLKALGAENAMNLDGGGSSAMYFNRSYKVGPGRNLPNAIVFAP